MGNVLRHSAGALFRLTASAGLLLAGCGQPPAPAGKVALPRIGAGSVSWYGDFKSVVPEADNADAQAIFGQWDDGLAFLILADVAKPGSCGAGGSSRANYDGRFHDDVHGRNIDWRCEASNRTTGTMTINGTSYDLKDGPLFLISTKERTLSVVQKRYDLEHLDPTPDNLEQFIKNVPEISEFFASAEKPTGGNSATKEDDDPGE